MKLGPATLSDKVAASPDPEVGLNALLDRISVDPAICGGKPCIRGTRLWVALILDFLADGMTEEDLRAEYPQLTHLDIMAAIAFGAEMTRERVLPIPLAQPA